MKNPANQSQLIKFIATELGFSFCGIAKAGSSIRGGIKPGGMTNPGYKGKMGYLENHFDMRLDPTNLVPFQETVVSLAYNYFPRTSSTENKDIKIPKYAFSKIIALSQ